MTVTSRQRKRIEQPDSEQAGTPALRGRRARALLAEHHRKLKERGMKTFGPSGSLKELQRKFDFKPESVVAVAMEALGRN
jgi:transketolase